MDRFDRDILNEIAEGERWLARFPTPPAPPETIDRIRQAVHAELGRQGRRGTPPRWKAWHGAAASAAALLLAVLAGWYSARSPAGAPAWGVEDLAFVEEISGSLEAISAMDAELSAIEALADEDAWALSGTALYEALDGAIRAEEPEELNDTGARLPASRRHPDIEDA